MKFGYSNGHVDGFTAAQKIYERQLAIITQELEAMRVERDTANTKVDSIMDQLLLRMGGAAIAPRTIANAERIIEKQEAKMQAMHAEGDPTADRPLGTPGSEFDQPNDPRADLFHDLNNLTEQ